MIAVPLLWRSPQAQPLRQLAAHIDSAMASNQRPPGYLPPHLRVMTPTSSPHASMSSSVTSSLTKPTVVQSHDLPVARSLAAASQSSDSSDQTLKSAALDENVTSAPKTQSRQSSAIPVSTPGKPSAPAIPNLLSRASSVKSGDTPPHLRSLQIPLMPAKAVQPATVTAAKTPMMEQISPKPEKNGQAAGTSTSAVSAGGANVTATTWQQLAGSVPGREGTTRKPKVDVIAKFARNHPCSYLDCPAGFDTLRGLKHHKGEKHDYCVICDVDCKDAAEFLKHKIKSEKHIVCPICSEDFKSSMGHDRHLKQVGYSLLDVPR